MFEHIERDADERGQVGIGTLIVFIALVLVAAIAAGVLINTAGFLQNQAESTGQESTNQVSNNVDVLSATGSVSSGEVDTVTVTLGLGPGSEPVDLGDTEFQVLDTTATSFDGSAAEIGGISSGDVLTEGETVQVDLTMSDFDGNLAEGDSVELTITTPDGSQTTEILNVPDPLDGSGDDVRL